MSARPGLCGGHQATGVPTAIANKPVEDCRFHETVHFWTDFALATAYRVCRTRPETATRSIRPVGPTIHKCLYASRNNTAQDASAGCARPYWALTTAYFQHRVWCSVSQLHMRRTAM